MELEEPFPWDPPIGLWRKRDRGAAEEKGKEKKTFLIFFQPVRSNAVTAEEEKGKGPFLPHFFC